jgi:hypothetical protein
LLYLKLTSHLCLVSILSVWEKVCRLLHIQVSWPLVIFNQHAIILLRGLNQVRDKDFSASCDLLCPPKFVKNLSLVGSCV